MDFEFRPRPFPTVIAVISALVLLSLAVWQFARFFEKSELEDEWKRRRAAPPIALKSLADLEGDQDQRPVTLHGTIDRSRVVFYDYQRFRSEPGCLVANPFELANGGTVLLVRGFVPHTRATRCEAAELGEPPTGELLALVHTLSPNLADVENRSQRGSDLKFNTFDVEGTYGSWEISDRPEGPTVVVLDEQYRTDSYPLPSFEHVSAPYLTAMRHLNYAGTWLVSLLFVVGIWGGVSIRRVDPPTA